MIQPTNPPMRQTVEFGQSNNAVWLTASSVRSGVASFVGANSRLALHPHELTDMATTSMIKRIWHGWTTHDNADLYENLLKEEVFPGIAAKNISGYRDIQLLRRVHDDEVEFVTIMAFDSWEAVKQFVGDEPSVSYVPAKAKEILSRWDDHSQHYEVRESRSY